MSSKEQKHKSKTLQLYLLMAALFGLGYYFLEFISTKEDPFLGNTFYIVVGCVLMAIPVVMIIKLFSDKSKRKKKSSSRNSGRSKRIFLDDKKVSEN